MTLDFIRKKEDFTCEHCGASVVGDGYTNHCPMCLWSKHVDINPGDRASSCGGMMLPERVEEKGGEYRIEHRCEQCGHTKRNKLHKDDAMEVVIGITAVG